MKPTLLLATLSKRHLRHKALMVRHETLWVIHNPILHQIKAHFLNLENRHHNKMCRKQYRKVQMQRQLTHKQLMQ